MCYEQTISASAGFYVGDQSATTTESKYHLRERVRVGSNPAHPLTQVVPTSPFSSADKSDLLPESSFSVYFFELSSGVLDSQRERG